MPALREIFASFGIQFNGRPLERGAQQVERMTGRIRGLVAAAAGTFAIRGINRFIRSTIDMGDELDKTSQQVGLTVDQLERLRYVANLGGVDATAMSNALGQLQRRADDAAHGGSETSEAFRRIGVDVHDSNGELLNAHDLFLVVADGLSGLENSSERTALSMELMGRQGRRLLPMLSGGSEEIERLENEFTTLVGGSLQEFVNLSRDAQDDLTRFSTTMMSFRARLAVLFLPIIRRSVQTLTQWGGILRDLAASSRIAESALIAFSVIAGIVALATIGTWGPILLVIAAAGLLALVIDDLWVAIGGGESVIGRTFDELAKAAGVAIRFEDIVQAVRTQWKLFAHPESIIPMIDQLLRLVDAGFSVRDVLQTMLAFGYAAVSMFLTFEARIRGFIATAEHAIESFMASFGALRPVLEFMGRHISPVTSAIEGARGARAGQERAGAALGRAVASPRTSEIVRGTAAGLAQKGTIDASSQVVVNVTGGAYATPAELGRAVSTGVREELDRHARRMQAALVPGAS